MGVMEIIGGIVMILIGAGIVVSVVLQQSPKGGSVNALTGSDSYYNKNQGRTRDAMLAKTTRGLAIAFFVVTLAVYTVAIYFPTTPQ